MHIPRTYTLNVEQTEERAGVWLCLDDGCTAEPIARFVSEEAAEKFKRAMSVAFAKAHTMGMMGL